MSVKNVYTLFTKLAKAQSHGELNPKDGHTYGGREELIEWADLRGVTMDSVRAAGLGYFQAGYHPIEPWKYTDELNPKVLLASGLFLPRRKLPRPPESPEYGSDVGTSRDGDNRPALRGLRPTFGGHVFIPKKDATGEVRSFVGVWAHRGHTLKEIAGDYKPYEDDPFKTKDGEPGKYRFLAGDKIRITRFFHPTTSKTRPLAICEGLIDALSAFDAGADAICLGGAFADEAQVDELIQDLQAALTTVTEHAGEGEDDVALANLETPEDVWSALVVDLKDPSAWKRPILFFPDNDPVRIDRGKVLELGPGQRGAARLFGQLASRHPQVARAIKVVTLPDSPDGKKVDLADLLHEVYRKIAHVREDESDDLRTAYYAEVREAKSATMTALVASASKELVDFCCNQLRVGQVAVRDWLPALDEVGLGQLAAADPALWLEKRESIAAALDVAKKERTHFYKMVERESAAQVRRDETDPLAEHTNPKTGKIDPTNEAITILVQRVLENDAGVDLWWNTMALCPMYGQQPFTNVQLGDLRLRLAREFKCHVRRLSDLREVIDYLAGKNPRNPVLEYLSPLQWDGVDRIPLLIDQILHLEPESDNQRRLYAAMIMRWLIGGVARAHATADKPVKMDNVLVLVGAQDLCKSSFFEHLVPNFNWYGSPDISSFDDACAIKLAGLLIAEMAESNGVSYWKDVERQKAFLSKRSDRILRKYIAYAETIPRTCILGATVNEEQHQSDPTGFRRQWCMIVKAIIDIALLVVNRDQIWAQAYHAFKAGEQWWFTTEEKALHAEDGKRYQTVDLERDNIQLWLLQEHRSPEVYGTQVAAGIGITRPSSWDSTRMARALKALGWTPQGVKRPQKYAAPEGFFSGGLVVLPGGSPAQKEVDLLAAMQPDE